MLASTTATACQAFAYGAALGLQFHAEIDGGEIERWLIGHAGELAARGIPPAELRERTGEAADAAETAGVLFIRDYLRGLR